MNQFPQSTETQVTLANWRTAPHNQWAFRHVSEIVPSAVIKNNPKEAKYFEQGPTLSLPDFNFEGATVTGKQLLDETHTDALVILLDGKIVYENYRNDMAADDPHILMSVSKSMLSLLAGILVEKGMLDRDAALQSYLPELKNSGFA